jgi:hypothetical protein
MGHIQPQKKRPNTSVRTMSGSDHTSALCSTCDDSAVVSATQRIDFEEPLDVVAVNVERRGWQKPGTGKRCRKTAW